MKQIDHKVTGGKFIRLQAKIENSVIKDILINGDFFIHPEEAITEIEDFLKNKKVQALEKDLDVFLNKKNIRIIGFEPKDLQEALEKTESES